jgi:hypothetical protein
MGGGRGCGGGSPHKFITGGNLMNRISFLHEKALKRPKHIKYLKNHGLTPKNMRKLKNGYNLFSGNT